MGESGHDFIKHALLVAGILLVLLKFIIIPLGLPPGLVYPELFICAVFLWIGLMDIATPLGALIITAIIFVVLLIL